MKDEFSELPPPKDLANPQQIQPPTPSTPLGGLLGSINPLAPSAPAGMRHFISNSGLYANPKT